MRTLCCCCVFIDFLHSYLGTHYIINITVNEAQNKAIEVTTVYSDYSGANGALLNFVFTDDTNSVNFTRSALLALDRKKSSNYVLPISLFPGKYSVLVFDIERNGTLSSGVSYPADTDVFLASEEGRGTYN